ncbi:MAG TPA: DNA alkylation repair protein [Propionibacteriaceae bacterium]|nr:DNA alkylation repair protein [Propionibacteriaceae bacterium]
MTADEVVARLKSLGNPDALRGMARYGIATDHALGVSMPQLRHIARETGRNHTLAEDLWRTGIHDARILASLIDIPEAVTLQQMDEWASDFDSWDLCDQCVMNLFARTQRAASTALQWSVRTEEFVKRAAFVIMARLASTNRTAVDRVFEPFLVAIERESTDARNFVKKGVNWALREIGARNEQLLGQSLQVAARLVQSDSASARWIGRDALKELQAKAAAGRLRHLG